MAENLKLKVTNYLRELYGPRGAAHLGGGDGGEEEDLDMTPSLREN